MHEIKLADTGISFIVEELLFDCGECYVTRDVIRKLGIHNVVSGIRLHLSGQWGGVTAKDKAANERAIVHGGGILSAFVVKSGKEFMVATDTMKATTVILG